MAPYNALMMPNNMRSWAIQFSPVTYYLSFFNFHKMESFIQRRWSPINSNTWYKIKLVFIYTIVTDFYYVTMLNSKNQTFWLVLLTQTKFSQLKRKYSQVQRYSQFLYIKECMKDKLASSKFISQK